MAAAKNETNRIAFLSFDWDYETVASYYMGVQAQHELTPDLQVVIFSAFGHYHVNYDPDPSAFEVFSLCDIRDYDGLIIQGNRVWPPRDRQKIVDAAHALGIPVVSINYALEHAHTIGTNNYQAMYDLVSTVLRDRKPARPAFVNGLATSVEAQDRARAYRDACARFGYEDARFYQASWQIEDGIALAHDLVASEEELPDAFFCCNDDLAMGIQDALQQHGVSVPDDVMITGFDNREYCRTVTPRLTSVDRDYFAAGKTALRTMRRILRGDDVDKSVLSPVQLKLRESCGYDSSGEVVDNGNLYSLDNSLKRFYEVVNNFQLGMYGADSIAGIMHVCEAYAHEMRCPSVFLTISDAYLQHGRDAQTKRFSPISHLMAYGGPADLELRDSRHVYDSFPSKEVLPEPLLADGRLYVVYPLYRQGTCIGTLVTEGVSSIMGHGFLSFSVTLLSAGIENGRNIELLREANSRLSDMYVHDELTGLFNRFGFERFGTITYEHLFRDFGKAFLTFVDIDDMKGINDKFGHEAGDDALRDAADIIRNAVGGENAFAMRYGGDEFLLISRNDLTARIARQTELHLRSYTRPYSLSLSVGTVVVTSDEYCQLSEAIRRADANMYEIKRRRKAGRC